MNQDQAISMAALLERALALAGQLESLDPAVSAPALELLDHLESWHREALTRLAMGLPAEVMDEVRRDPVVAHLFDVYLGEDDVGDPTALEDAPANPPQLLQIQSLRGR